MIDIYREILALKTDFQRVEKKLEDKINSVERRTDKLEVKVHEQDKRLSELGPCPNEDIEKLREELQKQQAYTRRYNLVIRGISRKADETNSDIQSHFTQYRLYKVGVRSLSIDKVHRLADPNLVIVRFVCLKERDRVWDARRKCKDLFRQEDHP